MLLLTQTLEGMAARQRVSPDLPLAPSMLEGKHQGVHHAKSAVPMKQGARKGIHLGFQAEPPRESRGAMSFGAIRMAPSYGGDRRYKGISGATHVFLECFLDIAPWMRPTVPLGGFVAEVFWGTKTLLIFLGTSIWRNPPMMKPVGRRFMGTRPLSFCRDWSGFAGLLPTLAYSVRSVSFSSATCAHLCAVRFAIGLGRNKASVVETTLFAAL